MSCKLFRSTASEMENEEENLVNTSDEEDILPGVRLPTDRSGIPKSDLTQAE